MGGGGGGGGVEVWGEGRGGGYIRFISANSKASAHKVLAHFKFQSKMHGMDNVLDILFELNCV